MADRPNILYLFPDQHAAHTLGCYGNQEVRTPHLDRLAHEGALFENAFAQSGLCAPSRMSIYTGCYPATLGARGNMCMYPEDLPPLIPYLHYAGYATAAIGKMHFVPGRRCPGFDVMRLTRGGHEALPDDDWREWLIKQDPIYEKRWPYAGGADFFDAHADFERNRHLVKCDLPLEHYVDTWITDETIRYLETRDASKPFFLWTGFSRPHDPYAPPVPYDTMYDPVALTLWPKPWGTIRHTSSRAAHWVEYRIDNFDPPHHTDYESWLRDALAAFYGQVTLVDDCVGRILKRLDELGLTNDTIVVYGTDHGDLAGRYGMMGKLVWGNDALNRVPMIWRVPSLKGGIRHRRLVENVDTFPTFFDLAGLPIPAQCQGESLAPALHGDAHCGKDAVFFQDEDAEGMRTDGWAWMRSDNGEHELYDLQKDPYQEKNLYKRNPSHRKAAEFDRQMTAAMVSMRATGR